MVKRNVAHREVKSVPAKKAGQPSDVDPANYHALAATHVMMSAPYQYMEHKEIRDPGVHGAVELYHRLRPKNALESILSTLIINVSNAANDCLSQAARVRPQELEYRDLSLRHAFKGAAVVTQLIDALERVRGSRSSHVTVGNVNVESGGQAIVGTVHPVPSTPRSETPNAENSSPSPAPEREAASKRK